MKLNISRVLKFLKENGLSPSTKDFLHTYRRGKKIMSALGDQAEEERSSPHGSGYMLAALTRERGEDFKKRTLPRLKTLGSKIPQTRASGSRDTGKRVRSMVNRTGKNLTKAFNKKEEEK